MHEPDPLFLTGCLVSSQADSDLLRLNPFLTSEQMSVSLNLMSIIVLHINRMGLLHRVLSETVELIAMVKSMTSRRPEPDGM